MSNLTPGDWSHECSKPSNIFYGAHQVVSNERGVIAVLRGDVSKQEADGKCMAASKQMLAALTDGRDKVVLARSFVEPGSEASEALIDARDILGAGIAAVGTDE